MRGAGFTAEEFLQMKRLPKGSELIDGSIVFSVLFGAPADGWEDLIAGLLRLELDRQATSDELRAKRQIGIRLDERQATELDVVMVTAEAIDEPPAEGSATVYRPEDDVVLIIEDIDLTAVGEPPR